MLLTLMGRSMRRAPRAAAVALLALLLPFAALSAPAHTKHQAPAPPKVQGPAPDVIIFTNGDRLSGKLLRAVNGTVTFHSDLAGDVNVTWDKIKELHATSGNFAVLEKGVIPERKLGEGQLSIGALSVEDQRIVLAGTAAATREIPSIPIADVAYVVDQASLDKELLSSPSFFQAWNGAATAGATLVKATENQYTVTSSVALARLVPTVNWLAPINRTTVDFSSSFGKIDSPAYVDASGVYNPESITKSNIFHADAERDEYFSQRVYYLGDLSLDHNYSQSLQLQQIYGVGVGWTPIKRPRQELDVKAVAQYESQKFFDTAAGINQNLIGATLSGNYLVTLKKGLIFNQQLSFLPAFNNTHAYSATETDTLTIPMYKHFGLTVGSLDSYLNDTPTTLPPTKQNSFQFTVGATYAIKSKY